MAHSSFVFQLPIGRTHAYIDNTSITVTIYFIPPFFLVFLFSTNLLLINTYHSWGWRGGGYSTQINLVMGCHPGLFVYKHFHYPYLRGGPYNFGGWGDLNVGTHKFPSPDKQGRQFFSCQKAVHDMKHNFFLALGCYKNVLQNILSPSSLKRRPSARYDLQYTAP